MPFLLQLIILLLLNQMSSGELLMSIMRPKAKLLGIKNRQRKSEVLNLARERNEKIGYLYRRLLQKYDHLSKPRSEIFSMLTEANCRDLSNHCGYWRYAGLCYSNQRLMKTRCKKSCGYCRVHLPTVCKDKSPYCAYWARIGECIEMPVFLNKYCPKSCRKCREDGSWGNWGEWTTCSQTCGSGNQLRYRKCKNPGPENGGQVCLGISSQQRMCNTKTCAKAPATEFPIVQPTNQGLLKCGVRTPTQIVSRIVGGNVARPRDWPWQVALKLSDEDKIICGASLINQEWAVTAGHCVRKFKADKGDCVVPNPSIRAVMGEYDLLNVSGHEVLRDVDKICLHSNYDYRTLDYDIALVHLKTPIASFHEFVTPVCLPRHENVTPVGTYCWITGFGRTEEGSLLSNHLRQAEIPIITREKCQELHPSRVISDRMFCAGYSKGEIDACKGDSGGPFVCEQANGRFYLIGTISWGVGCGRANQPGVYTEMRLFRGWIDDVVHSLRS